MKKITLLLMIIAGMSSLAIAQDSCVYYLHPDVLENKEISLKSTNELFDMNIMVGVKWLQVENKIHLIFDRRSASGNELFFLLFSMSKKNDPIASIVDCKSLKKTLWSKLKSNDSKNVQYFLKSDNLKIDNYSECFKLLANNNEEEFVFEIKEPEDFRITLPGFFVVKTEKRPWYSFSKRDKKLQFITKPFDLVIQFEKKPVVDTCAIAEKVVAYIEAQKTIMASDSEDLLEAQKNKSCVYFNLLKDIMRRKFIETNDKCERYAGCEEIAMALKDYKNDFEKIYQETCVAAAAPKASNCTLSESEMSSVNNRLKNLQMKINVKKRNNGNPDDEFKEYRSIKTAINARLTTECRKQYKSAIDAFNSYCANIESLQ